MDDRPPLRLSEIEARARHFSGTPWVSVGEEIRPAHWATQANKLNELLQLAKFDVPALIAEIDRLRGE